MEAVKARPRKKRSPRRDSESTPTYPLPTFRPFQLCTLTDTIPPGDNWLFEMKFDGYRAQIAISGSEVRVYTRNGHDWTDQFKVILPPFQTLTTGSVLLDGEIVAIDKAGRTNFSMLKSGIGAGIPLKFYAFDIFEKDGKDLGGPPLMERKAILEALIGTRDGSDGLQYSLHTVGNGNSLLNSMCAGGHEGVIAKRADDRYIGDRSTSWLKIKCTKRQEFVIGGWRPSDAGPGMASLLVGTFEKGLFVYRGRVGTGFSETIRDNLLKEMQGIQIAKPAFSAVPRDVASKARWVRPEMVAEVGYAEITADGSLRHASFQGMRADKEASKVVLEVPVDDGLTALDPAVGAEIASALGVKLSHPDKVMYPGTEITKAHLAAYYAALAYKMLPHLKDRPLSLVRDTDNDLAKTFFQKHALPGMPKSLKSGQLSKVKGTESRILWIEDLAGLIGGVQINTLEFHVWGTNRHHQPDLPERMVFDIDPKEGLGFEHVKQAATDIRDILGAIGLQSWPLLSGGKGVHVVVPLVPEADWGQVKSFCQNLAELLARS